MTQHEKQALRAEARNRLAALTPAARAAAGRAIATGVWLLPQIAEARVLLLYASLPSEVPTDDIAREAQRREIGLVYPRCLPHSRELTLHRVASDDELRPGSYGIREPHSACPQVHLHEIDAALIPGLAWDRLGRRIGRGAGYYDRLLAGPGWRGFICGLFFAAQELDSIPLDPWDVAMHAVVTEKEIWRREQGTGSEASEGPQLNREQ